MKNKSSLSIIFIVIFLIFLSLFLKSLYSKEGYDSRSEFLLGTVVEVTAADKRAFDIVFDEISRIENLMSIYKPESEISRLNLYGRLKASREVKGIIEQAKKFFYESEGAFDITVAPVVDLWKEAIKTEKLPDKRSLAKARKLVGSEKIIIDEEISEIKFLNKGMKIDLGGIAKGYAIDSALRKLKQNGINSCLINAGGDIYCLGRKARQLWRIGLQHPREPYEFIKYLELEDKAVATSADYEQYFILDNRRFSHIINPKTGYPAETDVISVTVISPDSLSADALATAIFVLGKRKGLELVGRYKDTEILFFTKTDLGFKDN